MYLAKTFVTKQKYLVIALSEFGEIQILIRKDGKQAIIKKAMGQIVDFCEGMDL
jgi:uncharacterized protein YjfI (DUF2170 family)